MGLFSKISIDKYGLEVEDAYGRVDSIVLHRTQKQLNPLVRQKYPDSNGSYILVSWFVGKDKTNVFPLKETLIGLTAEESLSLSLSKSSKDLVSKAYELAKVKCEEIRNSRDDI